MGNIATTSAIAGRPLLRSVPCWASRMFSATVMWVKMRRSSGTSDMPSRTRSLALVLPSALPSSKTSPRTVGPAFMMLLSSVLLPAPLRPSTEMRSPSAMAKPIWWRICAWP